MCTIEDITNFHGSLTFDMVKMFQYFESPSHVILSNTFHFSIFFHGNVIRRVCTWVCFKMFRSKDITNFHGSLALSIKVAGYFKSPYYPILLNSFQFSIFAFIKVLQGCICSCISIVISGIEDITNFHGSLTFDMVKVFQYFESRSYVILLNNFYFSIFAFM